MIGTTGRMGVCLIVAALSAPGCAPPSQEVQGASEALKQVASPAPQRKPEANDPVSILRADLAAFRSKSLPPEAAAREWLALADKLTVVSRMPFTGGRIGKPLSFTDALASLPPPASWNALAAAMSTRYGATAKRSVRSASMLLLGHLLNGDREAAWADAETLHTLLPKKPLNDGSDMTFQVLDLMESLAKSSRNPNRISKVVELQLTMDRSRYGGGPTSLPDLVSLIGAPRAATLLRLALLTSKSEVKVTGSATGKLVRRIALELAPKLKAPQWSLCNTVDSGALYEALVKRFPPGRRTADDENASNRRGYSGEEWRGQASMFYLVSLISVGRTKEASKIVATLKGDGEYGRFLPMEAILALREMGKTRALYTFLHSELSRDSTLPFWHDYISIATELGRTDEMLALIRSALLRKGLAADTRGLLEQRQYQALLAADKVDEGISQMRKMIASAGKSAEVNRSSSPMEMGLTLARIGKLLGREPLIDEGLKLVQEQLKQDDRVAQNYSSRAATLLVNVNRGPEAEKLLIGALKRASKGDQGEFAGPPGRQEIVDLCGLYHRAGRHADVLALLDGSPNWFARDVVDILGAADFENSTVGYMAASALANAGKVDKAVAILEALLRLVPNYDRGYQLLYKLRGARSIPFFDELYAQDQFEERPLIWKAHALFQAGKLDEAERAAQEAISIDPSDEEQGKGDRMRAYSVLADIRDARGDAPQAARYRGAVKAIRLSEEADEFVEAGLLTRAIAMYKQSLTYFADSCCIQSRLAMQLGAVGKTEEAEVHYRRAFELMPDSLGRMERRCSGCKEVLKGANAATLANKVFLQIAAKSPNKPQVHVLLGNLREEQGLFSEALGYYRRAAALDPLYINAWTWLQSVGERSELPQADIDDAAINLLRLDPQGRYSLPALHKVGDIRLLWTEVEAALKRQAPGRPDELYPLQASRPSIDKFEAQISERMDEPGMDIKTYMRSFAMDRLVLGRDDTTPLKASGQELAEHLLVGAVAQFIDAEARRAR